MNDDRTPPPSATLLLSLLASLVLWPLLLGARLPASTAAAGPVLVRPRPATGPPPPAPGRHGVFP